ncbi:hypothetical protein B7R22_13800 [Subtercola boreus]|uniref:DNA topoisomerase (ATP-hydrolyzing) n=1 Tax=Subtercola boreus TaxID=120213 RepID=A0A3E0VTM3_9MICO|nr:hypothetical protein [Subtercola boreus]RFA13236.1 hypothetical protein B7R22_13800 [Subtercola boreus]
MSNSRDENENLQHRKRQLEIMLQAQEHHSEIIQIVERARDHDALIESIAALLDISDGYAQMVRMMSVERLASAYERRRIIDELEELTKPLGD